MKVKQSLIDRMNCYKALIAGPVVNCRKLRKKEIS